MTHPSLAVAALLHAGGTAGRWGNLGLWAAEDGDYAGAATALADAVARAAGLSRCDAVVSVACGAGEELARWHSVFGARRVLGLEREAALVASAKEHLLAAGLGDIEVLASVDVLRQLRARPAQFDRVLVVDAAYHLGPRRALFDAAAVALKPGGRLVYTDLVLDAVPAGLNPFGQSPSTSSGQALSKPHLALRQAQCERDMGAPGGPVPVPGPGPGPGPGPASGLGPALSRHLARASLRVAATLTGVPLAHLGHADATTLGLVGAGFDDIHIERLDELVLGGFVRFVQLQRRQLGPGARGPAWRRIALTAALIPPCRAAGLGYALISARRSPRG